MFALIVTLISIALVAALALATLYYGGPIFNLGADRANAAKVAAQGQQIMGAMELYRAEKGVYPNTLADLVSDEYLKSIPVAQAEDTRALATALAAPGIWSLSSPGQPVIVLKPVSLATCMAYNKVNLGTSGVLQQARSTHLKQCIGTDVNNLMVVQPKAAADLVFVASNPAAVVQIGPVIATPLPPLSDKSASGWLDTSGTPPPPPPPPPPAGLGALSYSVGQGPTTALSFPDTEVNQSAAPLMLTLTNTGTANMTLTATPASTVAPFSVNPLTCASAILSVGASCQMSVGFTPTAQQSYSGGAYQLTMTAVSGTTPAVNLAGTGIAPLNLVKTEVTITGGKPYDQWSSDTDNAWLSMVSKTPNAMALLNAVPPELLINDAYAGGIVHYAIATGPGYLQGYYQSYTTPLTDSTRHTLNPGGVPTSLGGELVLSAYFPYIESQQQYVSGYQVTLPASSNALGGTWCVTWSVNNPSYSYKWTGVAQRGACF